MRHAASWYDGMDPEKQSYNRPELTIEGERSVLAIARRFKEFLEETGVAPADVTVCDVGTPQSCATAAALRHELSADGARSEQEDCDGDFGEEPLDVTPAVRHPLAPEHLSAYTATSRRVVLSWLIVKSKLGEGPCVLVGHDPQMSWLANHLLKTKRRWRWPLRQMPPEQRIALAPGELVWLEKREPGAKLQWVFSPSDPDTTAALYDKIKSKMGTAKILGTFLTALFTFSATQLLKLSSMPIGFEIAAGVGMTLLLIAVVLFFITVFRYDALLMPTRFWSADPPKAVGQADGFVSRPPGSNLWVLYQNMLRVWDHAFVPATQSAGLGVAVLAVAFLQPDNLRRWIGTAVAIVVVSSVLAVVLHNSKLRLGVND